EMYEVHAIMSIVLSILVGIHVIIQWNGFSSILDRSLVSQVGWVGVIALIVVMFSGIFSLSGIFVDHSPTLRNFKSKLNRELNLWLHRLAIASIIAVYFHMYFLPFLKDNFLFMVLLNIYTVGTLGFYIYWKFKIVAAPQYRVTKIYKATHSLCVLEFEPVK